MAYYLFRLLQQRLVVIGHPRLGYIAHAMRVEEHFGHFASHLSALIFRKALVFNHTVRGTRAARLQSGLAAATWDPCRDHHVRRGAI
jgi:hypothetical protein